MITRLGLLASSSVGSPTYSTSTDGDADMPTRPPKVFDPTQPPAQLKAHYAKLNDIEKRWFISDYAEHLKLEKGMLSMESLNFAANLLGVTL